MSQENEGKKQSPIGDLLSKADASLATLEKNIDVLRNDLQPILLSTPRNESEKAAEHTSEALCAVAAAISEIAYRIEIQVVIIDTIRKELQI